jgi:hypothetical protein
LTTEAATLNDLETKLKTAILELLFANKVQMQSARFRLTLIRDIQIFLKNTSPYSRNPQKEKRQMDKPNSGKLQLRPNLQSQQVENCARHDMEITTKP